MTTVLFLPGAGGAAAFWRPVGERLPAGWTKRYLSWPGLGHEPHDPAVVGMDDLVRLVDDAARERPVDLVAQSMGGVVAARYALAHPDRVRRLVLAVTSAGIDMPRFGAEDWRADYRASFPRAASWITGPAVASTLPVENITAPVLLIWGDRDPISPVAVGRHLAGRIPNAELQVIAGGDHDVAVMHADSVAPLIAKHFAGGGT